MSRNPYLAASRPASSFTRSSRTSKRNDLSSSKGSLLSRSRSSASVSALSSQLGAVNSYSSAAGYTPTWQRSLSSSRLNRYANDPSTSNLTNKASEYTAASHRLPERLSSYDSSRASLYRSSSSQDINNVADDDDDNVDTNRENLSHLENYQQSRIQQPQSRTRSSVQSLDSDRNTDSKLSLTSIESSPSDLSYADSGSITSGSAPRHLKQGHLLKSRSLDVNQRPPDASSILQGSMSVDRLLLRSESMSERDLRKSYKELVMENERLKRQLIGIDDREKQKQQDWIRKERQLQRKISELEEENRQLEQWRQDVQRLQDENSSLIRVVSKLSKKN